MHNDPRIRTWHIPVIYCKDMDHLWVETTAVNDLPRSRYLCAACGAEKMEQPTCIGTTHGVGHT